MRFKVMVATNRIFAVLAIVSGCVGLAEADYTIAPTDPISFAGNPGNINNSKFSGPVHIGGPTIYSERLYSGQLFAVGTSHVTSIDNNLRNSASGSFNLCCSVTATRTSPAILEEQTVGYFFFDPGDQLEFEAWTPAWTPDPFDPNSGPVRSQINNFSMQFSGEVDPLSLPDLGDFASGSFTFATVATKNPEDPDDPTANENDVLLTELAIYNAADHSPIAFTTTGNSVARYRELTQPLAAGQYYLAVGGALTAFSSRAIEATTVVGATGDGDVFNLELNGEALLTGALLERVDQYTYAPQLFTFNVVGPTLGDYNGDGAVDAADYTVWRDNLGAPDSVLPPGSTNDGSGVVDNGDYITWRDNYGSSSATGASASNAVPEPSTAILGMLMLSATGLVGSSRRNRLA